MLGRDILAAFIFDEKTEKYAPIFQKEDNWYLGNTLLDGGQTAELTIPSTAEMPYFVRSGCILPTNEAPYGFKSDETIIFTVYPLKTAALKANFSQMTASASMHREKQLCTSQL